MIEFHRVTAFQQQTRVLDQFSLKIEAQERVAILGPNGAGKSTLLKLINRKLYPVAQNDSYLKLFGSEKLHLFQLREKIGFVSQDLQEEYTAHTRALDVVISGFFGSVGCHEHLRPTQAQMDHARAMINILGFAMDETCMFQRLSTGQKRLLLARALVHRPEALIFDEPASGLDIGASQALVASLRRFSNKGRSVLIPTHHIEEIIPEIDRVVLMKNGRIVADGAKLEILTSERLLDLYQTPLHVSERNGWYRCWRD